MKYVYLIQIDGMNVYKIGYTKNKPEKRLENLQVGNPFKLLLVDYYKTCRASKIEAALHNRFAHNKINEDEYKLLGEWFELDNDTRKQFKNTCKQIDNNFKIIEESSMSSN